MKQNRTIIIFVVLAIALLCLFIWYNSERPRFDWREQYREEGKQPYDLDLVHALLQNYTKGGISDIKKDLRKEIRVSDTTANYVFIGEAFYFDSLETNHLLKFVKNGASALLVSKTVPFDLMPHLHNHACDSVYWDDYANFWDTMTVAHFWEKNLADSVGTTFKYAELAKTQTYNWAFINWQHFCEGKADMTSLGSLALNDSIEYVNFAKIPYGKGVFYLHTTPLAFTNYQLARPEGLEYAEKVFSYLNESGKIYWDASSRQIEAVGRRRNEQGRKMSNASINSEGPLVYILKQKSLKWAWYTLLVAGFLFVLFGAKRRRPLIPVLAPKTNTSLEFIQMIGGIYFKKESNLKICNDKIAMLLAFIRDRYGITVKPSDELFFERLAAKSEVAEAFLRQIFDFSEKLNHAKNVTNEEVVRLHQLIETFYKNSK